MTLRRVDAMWDDHGNRYDMMNGSGLMVGFGVLVLVLLGLALVAEEYESVRAVLEA